MELVRLRRSLQRWYKTKRRPLPWRDGADPYQIWVSEVMLQQTTVATVIPYYQRFLAAFPTLCALSAAPEEQVLRAWSGLGYYRRARHLQAAARMVMARGGQIPRSSHELMELPGVGDYTAAAIASIAFGEPVPVVDGNVVRVLTRLFGLAGDPKRGETKRSITKWATQLLDAGAAGDSNQALMELGATVCKPRNPDCNACPWRRSCVARAAGEMERYPQLSPRRATITVLRVAALASRRDGAVLLTRIPAGEPNEGLWEFPSAELGRGRAATARSPWAEDLRDRAIDSLRRSRGLRVVLGAEIARVRHSITHHRIEVVLLRAQIQGRLPRRDDLNFVPPRELPAQALTSATRKLARAIATPAP